MKTDTKADPKDAVALCDNAQALIGEAATLTKMLAGCAHAMSDEDSDMVFTGDVWDGFHLILDRLNADLTRAGAMVEALHEAGRR